MVGKNIKKSGAGYKDQNPHYTLNLEPCTLNPVPAKNLY